MAAGRVRPNFFVSRWCEYPSCPLPYPAIVRELVLQELKALGLPAAIRDEFPQLPPDVTAVMIYGSRARGDALPDSDLDALAITDGPYPTVSSGLTNLSYYTLEELANGVGTLFGEHLRRDGRVLKTTARSGSWGAEPPESLHHLALVW